MRACEYKRGEQKKKKCKLFFFSVVKYILLNDGVVSCSPDALQFVLIRDSSTKERARAIRHTPGEKGYYQS